MFPQKQMENKGLRLCPDFFWYCLEGDFVEFVVFKNNSYGSQSVSWLTTYLH